MTVERYADLARQVLARPPRLGRTRLVAVDGPSGAGKTVFATRLVAALDGAPVVHSDDLLAGWDDQFTFWSRLAEWVLGPLRAGGLARYRRYDWHRREFGPQWTELPPAPVVLLEGVSVARAEIRPELTLAVLVTAPSGLRLARALARDGVTIRPYLENWRRGEDLHFRADATAEHADLLVDGAPETPHDPAVEYVRIDPAWTSRGGCGRIGG
ncbi:Uridine kinase [Micromonospora pattaloongensis]|uniref:Uridine kinase n=1 Tax=Micromonospora pattaloongensis TaxID=405436 RepID=A0A1H3ST30_9ACTN|nr:hypothetical protein [Micromonospora pattaloongensis]SDZ41253.1 Uridine kinase [Micromonospora pattaloongensis]